MTAMVLPPITREYWVLVHWVLALVALAPYAVYQLRLHSS
jgi:hypothetical protein